MICKNCQRELPEDSVFCGYCGVTVKRKKSKQPLITGIAIGLCALIAILGVLVLTLGKEKYEKQLDIGYDLLNEGSYEEAVLAFDKAIKIDEKRPEGYMGKAESMAYDLNMTPEKADAIVVVLEIGYEKSGDKKVFEYKETIGKIILDNGFQAEAEIVTAFSVQGAPTEKAEEKSGAAWEEAYYNVLNGMVEEYGLYKENSSDYTGVAHASLMDLDSDGIYELYVMYGHKTNPAAESADELLYEVYTYKDGMAYRLAQENASASMDLHFSVTLAFDDAGNTYLVTDNSGLDTTELFLRTKMGDEWITREFFSYYSEDSGKQNNKIDGKEVSEDEFGAEWMRMNLSGENSGIMTKPDVKAVKELLEMLKNGEYKPETITGNVEISSSLTTFYWESMIQSYQVYDFKEDGTGTCYDMEPEAFYDKSLIETGIKQSFNTEDFTYELDEDGKLKVKFLDSGWETTLEYVSKTDNIPWDSGIYDILPDEEKFFYETTFVDDGMSNAMYLASTGIIG